MVLKCDQVSETTPNVCPVEELFRRSKKVAFSLSNSLSFVVMKTWQFAEDIEKENFIYSFLERLSKFSHRQVNILPALREQRDPVAI